MTVSYALAGPCHISVISRDNEGRVTRRSVLPGTFVDGEWAPTDLSSEAPEVQELASEHWTAEAIERFKRDNAPPVMPRQPGRIAKNAIWERATEAEAEAMEQMLAAQHVRIRRIYEGATHISVDHELFALMNGAMTQAFGATRAAELLAPTV